MTRATATVLASFALGLALALAACAVAGPSPSLVDVTPVPGGVTGAAPVPHVSFDPPTSSTLDEAIAGLDSLRSYRVTLTESAGGAALAGAQAGTRIVVVNGPPHRARTDEVLADKVIMSEIQVGSKRWRSFAGSTWEPDDFGDIGGDLPADAGDEGWANPLEGRLDYLQEDASATFVDLPVELHGTVPCRHVRATMAARADNSVGFVGAADIWIAVDGGWLAGMTVNGINLNRPADDDGNPTGTPAASALHVDLAVEGIDDPANSVEEPVEPEATPLPSGDPAVVALIEAIRPGLAALDAYEVGIGAGTGGAETTMTLAVVNRPVPGIHLVLAAPGVAMPAGTPTEYLVIGDRGWTREGPGPWQLQGAGERSICGPSGSDACTRMLDAMLEPLLSQAVTFTRVSGDQLSGGVRAVHLHSDAGMASGGGSRLPGPIDVWVARDGGRLVRVRFEGSVLAYDITISRPNDPALSLEPPASFLPAPSAAATRPPADSSELPFPDASEPPDAPTPPPAP
jgi:hypothetical protein